MASLKQTTPGVTDLDASGDPVVEGAFYGDVTAAATLDAPLQDDAADTVIVNNRGTNGTLIGAGNTSASSIAGPNARLPKAIDFDGVDDYIDTSIALSGNSVFAACWRLLDAIESCDLIASWVNFGSVPDPGDWSLNQELSGNHRSRWFFYDDASSVVQAVDPTNPVVDTWQHLAGYYDAAGNSTLWVNGVAVATASGANTALGGNRLRLGCRKVNELNLDGRMAGVVVGVTAPPAGWATALYNGPEPTVTAAPCNFTGGQLTGTPTVDNPTGETVLPYTLVQQLVNGKWVTVAEGANYDAYTPTESGEFSRVYAPGYASNRRADPVRSSSVVVSLVTGTLLRRRRLAALRI